eukprot:snap_masked-scaffold_11-processed-gene-1.41-mRNA-1 protein AED:1.00 eAED:1.00 QI:0/-1/0/0/-1/1/1/0/213
MSQVISTKFRYKLTTKVTNKLDIVWEAAKVDHQIRRLGSLGVPTGEYPRVVQIDEIRKQILLEIEIKDKTWIQLFRFKRYNNRKTKVIISTNRFPRTLFLYLKYIFCYFIALSVLFYISVWLPWGFIVYMIGSIISFILLPRLLLWSTKQQDEWKKNIRTALKNYFNNYEPRINQVPEQPVEIPYPVAEFVPLDEIDQRHEDVIEAELAEEVV